MSEALSLCRVWSPVRPPPHVPEDTDSWGAPRGARTLPPPAGTSDPWLCAALRPLWEDRPTPGGEGQGHRQHSPETRAQEAPPLTLRSPTVTEGPVVSSRPECRSCIGRCSAQGRCPISTRPSAATCDPLSICVPWAPGPFLWTASPPLDSRLSQLDFRLPRCAGGQAA